MKRTAFLVLFFFVVDSMCSRLEVGGAPAKRSISSLGFSIPAHSVFLASNGTIISNAALNDPRRGLHTKEKLKKKLEERKNK